jgi:restriction endonuclease S subunit
MHKEYKKNILNNIKKSNKGFVNYENSSKISVDLHNKLKSYQTKYNDILLTIVGNSIGDVGIVKFNLEKCNLTENCAKVISLKNNLKANYLFSFLNSKFGQLQISRETVGTARI